MKYTFAIACVFGLAEPVFAQSNEELARQVEIRRTAYGVPHILAQNYRALGFGMGYAQVEDYGLRVVHGLVEARGELGLAFGQDSTRDHRSQEPQDLRVIDVDYFLARTAHRRAVETFHMLDPDVRAVMEGFAAGVNYYIARHRAEFPDWVAPRFVGHDVVAAWDIGVVNLGKALRTVRRMLERERQPAQTTRSDADEGSNAWAFAPSRTKSGRAILLRNPHGAWSGRWEAHVTIPGTLNFYGDFSIGTPFGIIAGFNEHLGWATTVNWADTDEVYALDVDPSVPDHYLLDGASMPLERITMTAEFRNGPGVNTETREFWTTPLGPVVERTNGKIFVVREAGYGGYRHGEQTLRMMRANSLAEWKNAMRVRAKTSQNFTYADRKGNIFYIWNGSVPALPLPSGGDTVAVNATRSDHVWSRLFPFDSLPQVLNPKGGYIHNENDPFHYTNLNQVIDSAAYPPYFPRPRLGLRSQHALQLIHNGNKFSLEDVVRLKHSMRMLLADRVKADLLALVRATSSDAEGRAAADLLERWDNTVAPDSRGGVLFETWWHRYAASQPQDSLYAESWTPKAPTTTPRGLKQPDRAREAFVWAVQETKRRYGAYDVAWGDVHRVMRGDVDVPVGGCTGGALGCFRVLWFEQRPDGRRVVNGGDGWVLAVEFTDVPRAYSVLGYGLSAKPESPHFDDQAAMFARGEMKKVAFTEEDIRKQLIRTYHPGQ